jgi:cell division topological specificity factor
MMIMNIFSMFSRRSSAPLARERLKILLTHERGSGCSQELVANLHRAVLEAIAKHIDIDPDKVDIEIRHRETFSLLEINLEIPAIIAKAGADLRAPNHQKENPQQAA